MDCGKLYMREKTTQDEQAERLLAFLNIKYDPVYRRGELLMRIISAAVVAAAFVYYILTLNIFDLLSNFILLIVIFTGLFLGKYIVFGVFAANIAYSITALCAGLNPEPRTVITTVWLIVVISVKLICAILVVKNKSIDTYINFRKTNKEYYKNNIYE